MKEIIVLPNGNKKVRTINNEPSLTQQHHKQECDVNYIVKKYQKTGQITHIARDQGVYADLTKSKDFSDAMNTVVKAKEAFMTLPSDVRKRFGHNPQELISFLQDEKNLDEAIKLGLVKSKPNISPSIPSQPISTPNPSDKPSA